MGACLINTLASIRVYAFLMDACLINTLASIRVYAFLIINAVVCLVDRLLLVCLRVFALAVV
jgi:hypothetical protein